MDKAFSHNCSINQKEFWILSPISGLRFWWSDKIVPTSLNHMRKNEGAQSIIFCGIEFCASKETFCLLQFCFDKYPDN